MNRVSPKVLALLGTLTLVWGTNWPLFKIALDELPVLTFRAIVLFTTSESYAHAPAGLFWGLFAGFCWAVGTFIVKRTSWQGMGLSLTFWQVVITLPPILLGALVIDGLPTRWPSKVAVVATIYTGAVPMALGTAAWFALVKLLPAQVPGLAAIAIPIVAITR